MPGDFLMEQMAWREALEEASTEVELDALNDQLNLARNKVLQRIEQLLDEQNDAALAVQQVRGLMFIERFGRDVEARFEQLGQ